MFHFHFHNFVQSSSIEPAGILKDGLAILIQDGLAILILANLILHIEVFEKTVVGALVLLHLLLNYDLAILQIEYYFLMLA